jgi:hypothetical protein
MLTIGLMGAIQVYVVLALMGFCVLLAISFIKFLITTSLYVYFGYIASHEVKRGGMIAIATMNILRSVLFRRITSRASGSLSYIRERQDS